MQKSKIIDHKSSNFAKTNNVNVKMKYEKAERTTFCI